MRTKKFIVALCFSFFMFMCSVSTVYAYNTYNQHKLTYGVGNYGKIQLDADFSDLSENKRLAVIAHEMGHVMGLAHSDFSNVLMRADIAYNSSSTSRAQTNDLGGINYLYK